ncbi:MAG: NAD dependent epimerase/dehydratase family enzyme [Saprospiraceae bacterium]
MKVIITGSTGMIGSCILSQCLKSTKISEVISLVTRTTHIKHQKLIEIEIQNFEDYTSH